MNSRKSSESLYTNRDPSRNEENDSITVAPGRESIGTELTEEVEQACSENYKLSRKRRQTSGKTACVYGLGNLILLKCRLRLKQSTRSGSVKNERTHPEIPMEPEGDSEHSEQP